jgi:hypothetical protein
MIERNFPTDSPKYYAVSNYKHKLPNAYGSPSEIPLIYSLHFNGTDLYRTQDQLTVDDRVIFLKYNKKERKKLRNEINKNKH